MMQSMWLKNRGNANIAVTYTQSLFSWSYIYLLCWSYIYLDYWIIPDKAMKKITEVLLRHTYQLLIQFYSCVSSYYLTMATTAYDDTHTYTTRATTAGMSFGMGGHFSTL